MAAITLAQQNPRQRHRSSRTGIHRQRPNLPEGPPRNQQNAPYRPFTGNAHLRNEIEPQTVKLGAGRQTDMRGTALQRGGADRWQIETEIKKPALRTMQKSPNQRPRIQITDSRNDQSPSLPDSSEQIGSRHTAHVTVRCSDDDPHTLMRTWNNMQFPRLRHVHACLALLALGVSPSFGQITLNTSPTRIIGQTSLSVTNLNPNLVEGREFFEPIGIAIDPNAGPPALYVSDTGNNRVLGFRSAASFANGAHADIVIGQPDFVTTFPEGPRRSTGGISLTTGLASPTGLAVDAQGNLYIVDSANNRVLRFPKPFQQSGVLLPDLVLGQAGFSSGSPNRGATAPTASSLVVRNHLFLWFPDPEIVHYL